MDAAGKLIQNHELSREEYIELLEDWKNPEVSGLLTGEAVKLRRRFYGNKVYTRALIAFTNCCNIDCYYCGISRCT